MGRFRSTAAAVAILAAGVVAFSGGSGTDPRTPPGLPGLPAPLFGTAVVGSGGLTAAVDAYGNVVDLRSPGPPGRALVAVPAARQAAGTAAVGAALPLRMELGDGRAAGLWRAAAVRQRYVPGTNVLRTVARGAGGRAEVLLAARGGRLVCRVGPRAPIRSMPCELSPTAVAAAIRADRRWLGRARPLGPGAPVWARRMYRRSLLVLRALTDRRTGAVAAGARDGWAYVWPRDAAAAGIALAAAGYRPEARRVARFLLGLDLEAAARFRGTGAPVAGRDAQGDAAGWAVAAARAAGLEGERIAAWVTGGGPGGSRWRGRADYQEGDPGDYLGNAIATAGLRTTSRSSPAGAREVEAGFGSARGLTRIAADPASGLDSAAAWAVRPFRIEALYPAARRTLRRIAADGGRFGIVPSQGWRGGEDPWTAPTAWTAWALAALAGERQAPAAVRRRDRRAALRLVAALRRTSTPLGLLPERVDARSGRPRSTTPLAWSHAFAILALRAIYRRQSQPR